MSPGKVARIRVNPGDCLGICDVMDKLGLTSERFSFDQACRIALSSLLESARLSGAIPRRDGYEYNEMMARFRTNIGVSQAQRLEVTKLVSGAVTSEHPTVQPLVPEQPERRRRRARYQELLFLRQQDPTNFSQAQLEELVPLITEFQPEV